MRIYDPRLGRFLSVDPLANEYAWNSPYSFAENDVIRSTDLDGAEKNIQITSIDKTGKLNLSVIPYSDLFPGKSRGSLGYGTAWLAKNPKTGKYQFVQYIPSFYDGKLGKLAIWLGIQDKNNFSEAEGPTHNSDVKRKDDPKGDGRPNMQDSPDDPYNDVVKPNKESTPVGYEPKTKDNDGWTIVPDQSGHQKKQVAPGTILYKDEKSKDTIEMNYYGEHITNKNSERWKQIVNDNKPKEKEKE